MNGHVVFGEEGEEQEPAQTEGNYVALAKEDVQWVPEMWVRPINRENPKVNDPTLLEFTYFSQVDILGAWYISSSSL